MFKRLRPLDAAIIAVAILVIGLGAFLGYSVWSNNRVEYNNSPAGRQIQAYIAALKKNPKDIDTRMRLAQALSVAGKDREAVQQYQEILKISKEYVPALSGLGFELLKQKKWAEGETYFKKVIALTEPITPANAGTSSLELAYYYTGVARMEQRDYQGAIGYLKNALRLRSDASDTAYALAVSYRNIGEQDGYRDMLVYTLKFDPRAPEANYDYGQLLLSKGDEAGAAEHFRTSADAAPYKAEPQDALKKLGSASDRLAKAEDLASTNTSQALAQARVAVALDPQSVEALNLAGKLYEKAGNKTKAADCYNKVLLIDPSNAVAKAGLKRVTKRAR